MGSSGQDYNQRQAARLARKTGKTGGKPGEPGTDETVPDGAESDLTDTALC